MDPCLYVDELLMAARGAHGSLQQGSKGWSTDQRQNQFSSTQRARVWHQGYERKCMTRERAIALAISCCERNRREDVAEQLRRLRGMLRDPLQTGLDDSLL